LNSVAGPRLRKVSPGVCQKRPYVSAKRLWRFTRVSLFPGRNDGSNAFPRKMHFFFPGQTGSSQNGSHFSVHKRGATLFSPVSRTWQHSAPEITSRLIPLSPPTSRLVLVSFCEREFVTPHAPKRPSALPRSAHLYYMTSPANSQWGWHLTRSISTAGARPTFTRSLFPGEPETGRPTGPFSSFFPRSYCSAQIPAIRISDDPPKIPSFLFRGRRGAYILIGVTGAWRRERGCFEH